MSDKPPEDRDPLPIVTFRRQRCPTCGSPKLTTYGSRPASEAVVERYTRCRACGLRFRALIV